MYVLVTGSNGQLGSDILDLLKARGISAKGYDMPELDITDKQLTQKIIDKEKPSHVIHCAAYTLVDQAETDREICRKVNVTGTENLALACKNIDSTMIYISTDYVFDGTGDKEWTEESLPSPLNWYGRTKLNGENAVKKLIDKYYIIRTSWVFGNKGSNFIKTMLRLSRERTKISVIKDQIGSPTYTRDLAVVIIEMLFSNLYGTYNVTNTGFCSWYDLACETFNLCGIKTEVIPVITEEYPSAALRPLNSRLSKEKLAQNNFPVPIVWKDALHRYLIELGEISS